ncbi:hypothetical protein BKA62DRAFT_711392 [Auriculariales sp. MPI-PUGE-AT-0066]|nr:hypothetical protein BKA62DRAFT_711392 [Auriculariales sp. MPI-PUGE-AT-0066]
MLPLLLIILPTAFGQAAIDFSTAPGFKDLQACAQYTLVGLAQSGICSTNACICDADIWPTVQRQLSEVIAATCGAESSQQLKAEAVIQAHCAGLQLEGVGQMGDTMSSQDTQITTASHGDTADRTNTLSPPTTSINSASLPTDEHSLSTAEIIGIVTGVVSTICALAGVYMCWAKHCCRKRQ